MMIATATETRWWTCRWKHILHMCIC